MKLEKHRYEDVVILKFTGEFDTFNLPGFSERIDRMIQSGDVMLVLDLYLLKFINSAALGYLIKTSKKVKEKNGEMVLARPSKFIRKTLTTLGLDDVFKIFESVEAGIKHFKTGESIGEVKLEGGEYDESLTGSVPILFRPLGNEAAEALPNQVGRIVTLYEDGLLFRYEPDPDKGPDPVEKFLNAGQELKLKFRQPFAVKEYYFEMRASVVEVSRMGASDDEESAVDAIRVTYNEIKDEDRKHLEQFVRDQKPGNPNSIRSSVVPLGTQVRRYGLGRRLPFRPPRVTDHASSSSPTPSAPSTTPMRKGYGPSHHGLTGRLLTYVAGTGQATSREGRPRHVLLTGTPRTIHHAGALGIEAEPPRVDGTAADIRCGHRPSHIP